MSARPFIATCCVAALLAGGAWWLGNQTAHNAAAQEVSGKPAIGGDFSLTTQSGKQFTEANLKGRYSLIFFGFSNCPDMCPTALATITEALNSLPEAVSKEIQPVFITVDPERDTVEQLAEYSKNFHPSLISLTGSKEETEQAARAFKVYFQSLPKEAGGEQYQVNHSGYIYLMDKNGQFKKPFAYDIAPDALAEQLKALTAG